MPRFSFCVCFKLKSASLSLDTLSSRSDLAFSYAFFASSILSCASFYSDRALSRASDFSFFSSWTLFSMLSLAWFFFSSWLFLLNFLCFCQGHPWQFCSFLELVLGFWFFIRRCLFLFYVLCFFLDFFCMGKICTFY